MREGRWGLGGIGAAGALDSCVMRRRERRRSSGGVKALGQRGVNVGRDERRGRRRAAIG